MSGLGTRFSAIGLCAMLTAQCGPGCAPGGTGGEPSWSPPPSDLPADYQLGGDYPPPPGVEIVVGDWFSGRAEPGRYSICYVTAFQTQPDEPSVDRPDERSRWPSDLVLSALGDDPAWPGEYLIDLATNGSRRRAADWVTAMLDACAAGGFDAVELDNLDSWTRFDGTPRAGRVPFGETEAVAYAELLTDAAHDRGLAVAQKNALEIDEAVAWNRIGLDFAIVEECGEEDECGRPVDLYAGHVIAVEYDADAFTVACATIGDRVTVVHRDLALSTPGDAGYVYDEC